jgi:hypothetical protein
MAEFDEGISLDESGLEGFSDEAGTEEVADVEVDELDTEEVVEDNPWSWVDEKGVTPDVVRDSYENFTKKTQDLARERETLQPYQELMQELQGDPALQRVIREYFASGATPEKEIENIASELRTVQTQIAVDAEFKALREYVEAENLTPVNEDKVMEYAVAEGMPSMMAAYKAMYFEDARASARASLEKDIKKGKSAAVPKSNRSDGGSTSKLTAQDVANMSEEDFVKGYQGVVKGIVGS